MELLVPPIEMPIVVQVGIEGNMLPYTDKTVVQNAKNISSMCIRNTWTEKKTARSDNLVLKIKVSFESQRYLRLTQDYG
jgi:hypothetical protein